MVCDVASFDDVSFVVKREDWGEQTPTKHVANMRKCNRGWQNPSHTPGTDTILDKIALV